MRFLLALAAVAAFTCSSTALIQCEVQCPHDGFFCDVNDPMKFYQCLNGASFGLQSCGPGTHFNPQHNVCDWPDNVPPGSCTCGPRGTVTLAPASATTTSPETTTTTATPRPTLPTRTTTTTTTKRPRPTPSTTTTTTTTTKPLPNPQVRMCYYTNWSQYRPGLARMKVEYLEANPTICTHVIVAFEKAVNLQITTSEWNDDRFMNSLTSIRDRLNPRMKVLVAVGGWSAGVREFDRIVATMANRNAFDESVVAFLHRYNLDGIDIDWEFPAQRGSPWTAKRGFAKWVTELRARFDRYEAQTGRSLMLTAAVGVTPDMMKSSYDVPTISRSLNYINLMTFDLAGGHNAHAYHHSPLYASSIVAPDQKEFNQATLVQQWIDAGAAREQLVLGIALYGRQYRLTDPNNYKVNDLINGTGTGGVFTGEAGYISYFESCMNLKCGAYENLWDPEQSVPYMHKVGGLNWLGYDNLASVRTKTRFAKDTGLAGVMVWAIDLDDASDICNTGVTFPMMKTIKAVQRGRDPPYLDMTSPAKDTRCGSI